jgi:hypothetical protein
MNGKQIQKITSEGLIYLDEKGEERFIDFLACYEKELQRFMNPDNLKRIQDINGFNAEQLEQSIQRHKEWKVVADRSIIGEPIGTAPYIEFYTEPLIRFEFDTKDEFQKVRHSIEQERWRTSDRS